MPGRLLWVLEAVFSTLGNRAVTIYWVACKASDGFQRGLNKNRFYSGVQTAGMWSRPSDHTTLQTLSGIVGGKRRYSDFLGHHQWEHCPAEMQGLRAMPCHLQQRNIQLSKKIWCTWALVERTFLTLGHCGQNCSAAFSQTHQVTSYLGSEESQCELR